MCPGKGIAMAKSFVLRGLVLGVVTALAGLPAFGVATECDVTVNDCVVADNQTASHIQIGGPDSQSSSETCGGFEPCDDPGRLDNGTVAEAFLSFLFDRAAATLTLELHNTTDTTASLTAVYF